MSLPIWASQVWAQKPDIQQMIDSQKADQARQAQLALSSVGLMVEQQKLSADQRNFQQSMALKMQEDASRQAAQAWEMQLAEKKLAQQGLQDQLENERIKAQIANYNRMNQPVAATAMPSYPTFDAAGNPTTTTTTNGEPVAAMPVGEELVQPVDVPASIVEPTMNAQTASSPEALLAASMGAGPAVTMQGGLGNYPPVAIPAGASSIVPPTTPDVQGTPSQPVQYAPMPAAVAQPTDEGPNPLLPSVAQKPTALPTSTAADDYSGLKIGEVRSLGEGLAVKKLPNNQVSFGEWKPATKTKAAGFDWGAPTAAVKKTASKVDTSAEKEKAAQAAVAAEITAISQRYPDLGQRAQKVLSTPGLSETTVRSLASDLKQEAADRVKVETTAKTKEEKAVATAQKAIAEAEKTDKADLWKVRNSIGDDLKVAQKQQAKLAESKSSDPELDSRVEELKARYGAYNQKITEHISDQAKSAEDAAVAKYNPTQQEKIDAFTAAKGRPPATGKPTDPAVIKDWGEAYYLAKDAYAKSKGLSTAAAPSASAVSPVASSASGVPFWQKWSSQK